MTSDQPTEASAPPQLCVTCKTPMITKRQVVDRVKCDNFDCVDCGRTQREYNVASPVAPRAAPDDSSANSSSMGDGPRSRGYAPNQPQEPELKGESLACAICGRGEDDALHQRPFIAGSQHPYRVTIYGREWYAPPPSIVVDDDDDAADINLAIELATIDLEYATGYDRAEFRRVLEQLLRDLGKTPPVQALDFERDIRVPRG